jgi:2-polyprenyl-3-methyl-5-hydroxy-6-metoxy-1,4-benzoquinol methylase
LSLGEDKEILYRGSIRAGKPGVQTKSEFTVWRCKDYDIAFLEGDAPRVDYESDEYRETYDGSRDSDTFFAIHDQLSRRYLKLLDGIPLRARFIADFGCGAGSFLDLVHGIAKTTVGIEPHQRFRNVLELHGHRAYAYASEFLRSGGEQSVDIAVSFHVIEHVDDPRGFLREIRECVRPGGLLCIATPNLHDIMLRLGGEPYRRFFYRTAHRWYFSGPGLARLVDESGFSVHRLGYLQEYDLGNAFSWLRERRPCGNGSIPYLNEQVETAWMASLEASGMANVTYVIANRPAE